MNCFKILAASCLIFLITSITYSSCPPPAPPPLTVETGVWGKPPALLDIPYPQANGGYVDYVQIEFWQITGYGNDKLIYRRWLTYDDLMWRSKHFFFMWYPRNDGFGGKYYLVGKGPGKLQTFPAGDYYVRWRSRITSCQSGSQDSGWTTTSFKIDAQPENLEINVNGPGFVGEQDDLDYTWTNNFAASSYRVEVKQGNKVVRKANVAGGFGYYYYGKLISSRPGLDEPQIAGGAYRDRPAYNRELPDETGYVFRVSGYSPIARKWSSSTEMPFEIRRGAPRLPSLIFSQSDYEGFYDRSLRPYFSADYGDRPALWSYFEILNKNKAGKLSTVRKGWFSRYNFDGQIGGAGGKRYPEKWQKDLPPGEYVWRVRAYNGPSPEQTVWTAYQTNVVIEPGLLGKPDDTKLSYKQDFWNAYVQWDAVPNAYAYKYEIRRSGKIIRSSKVLDLSNGIWFEVKHGVLRANAYVGKPLPELADYQIRVQAINDANPAGKSSEWSDWKTFSLVPASISGRVTDLGGNGVSGAKVSIAMLATEEEYYDLPLWWTWIYQNNNGIYWVVKETSTDSNGYFTFNRVASGAFKVRFHKYGYDWQMWPNISSWSLFDGDDLNVADGQAVTNVNAVLVSSPR